MAYQGWKNYETWLVALWLDNDEYSYNYWRERTQEIWEGATADKPFSRRDRAMLELSDTLKDEVEDAAPELEGIFLDLLNAALSEVDWREIADHWLDERHTELSDENQGD